METFQSCDDTSTQPRLKHWFFVVVVFFLLRWPLFCLKYVHLILSSVFFFKCHFLSQILICWLNILTAFSRTLNKILCNYMLASVHSPVFVWLKEGRRVKKKWRGKREVKLNPLNQTYFVEYENVSVVFPPTADYKTSIVPSSQKKGTERSEVNK